MLSQEDCEHLSVESNDLGEKKRKRRSHGELECDKRLKVNDPNVVISPNGMTQKSYVVCPVCSRNFPHAKYLAQHFKTHSKNTRVVGDDSSAQRIVKSNKSNSEYSNKSAPLSGNARTAVKRMLEGKSGKSHSFSSGKQKVSVYSVGRNMDGEQSLVVENETWHKVKSKELRVVLHDILKHGLKYSDVSALSDQYGRKVDCKRTNTLTTVDSFENCQNDVSSHESAVNLSVCRVANGPISESDISNSAKVPGGISEKPSAEKLTCLFCSLTFHKMCLFKEHLDSHGSEIPSFLSSQSSESPTIGSVLKHVIADAHVGYDLSSVPHTVRTKSEDDCTKVGSVSEKADGHAHNYTNAGLVGTVSALKSNGVNNTASSLEESSTGGGLRTEENDTSTNSKGECHQCKHCGLVFKRFVALKAHVASHEEKVTAQDDLTDSESESDLTDSVSERSFGSDTEEEEKVAAQDDLTDSESERSFGSDIEEEEKVTAQDDLTDSESESDLTDSESERSFGSDVEEESMDDNWSSYSPVVKKSGRRTSQIHPLRTSVQNVKTQETNAAQGAQYSAPIQALEALVRNVSIARETYAAKGVQYSDTTQALNALVENVSKAQETEATKGFQYSSQSQALKALAQNVGIARETDATRSVQYSNLIQALQTSVQKVSKAQETDVAKGFQYSSQSQALKALAQKVSKAREADAARSVLYRNQIQALQTSVHKVSKALETDGAKGVQSSSQSPALEALAQKVSKAREADAARSVLYRNQIQALPTSVHKVSKALETDGAKGVQSSSQSPALEALAQNVSIAPEADAARSVQYSNQVQALKTSVQKVSKALKTDVAKGVLSSSQSQALKTLTDATRSVQYNNQGHSLMALVQNIIEVNVTQAKLPTQTPTTEHTQDAKENSAQPLPWYLEWLSSLEKKNPQLTNCHHRSQQLTATQADTWNLRTSGSAQTSAGRAISHNSLGSSKQLNTGTAISHNSLGSSKQLNTGTAISHNSLGSSKQLNTGTAISHNSLGSSKQLNTGTAISHNSLGLSKQLNQLTKVQTARNLKRSSQWMNRVCTLLDVASVQDSQSSNVGADDPFYHDSKHSQESDNLDRPKTFSTNPLANADQRPHEDIGHHMTSESEPFPVELTEEQPSKPPLYIREIIRQKLSLKHSQDPMNQSRPPFIQPSSSLQQYVGSTTSRNGAPHVSHSVLEDTQENTSLPDINEASFPANQVSSGLMTHTGSVRVKTDTSDGQNCRELVFCAEDDAQCQKEDTAIVRETPDDDQITYKVIECPDYVQDSEDGSSANSGTVSKCDSQVRNKTRDDNQITYEVVECPDYVQDSEDKKPDVGGASNQPYETGYKLVYAHASAEKSTDGGNVSGGVPEKVFHGKSDDGQVDCIIDSLNNVQDVGCSKDSDTPKVTSHVSLEPQCEENGSGANSGTVSKRDSQVKKKTPDDDQITYEVVECPDYVQDSEDKKPNSSGDSSQPDEMDYLLVDTHASAEEFSDVSNESGAVLEEIFDGESDDGQVDCNVNSPNNVRDIEYSSDSYTPKVTSHISLELQCEEDCSSTNQGTVLKCDSQVFNNAVDGPQSPHNVEDLLDANAECNGTDMTSKTVQVHGLTRCAFSSTDDEVSEGGQVRNENIEDPHKVKTVVEEASDASAESNGTDVSLESGSAHSSTQCQFSSYLLSMDNHVRTSHENGSASDQGTIPICGNGQSPSCDDNSRRLEQRDSRENIEYDERKFANDHSASDESEMDEIVDCLQDARDTEDSASDWEASMDKNVTSDSDSSMDDMPLHKRFMKPSHKHQVEASVESSRPAETDPMGLKDVEPEKALLQSHSTVLGSSRVIERGSNVKTVMLNNELEQQRPLEKEGMKCKACFKVFVSKKALERHVLEHSSKFECHFCGKTLSCRKTLRHHLERHRTKKAHVCDVCDREYFSKNEFVLHQRSHTMEPNFECEICHKEFAFKESVQVHKVTFHKIQVEQPADRKKTWECFACGITVDNSAKTKHIKEHQGTENEWTCRFCSQKYSVFGMLRKHIRSTHKKCKCPVCGVVFLKQTLQRHLRTHTGEKPFQCEVCGRSFSQKVSLSYHRLGHKAECSFACNECDKTYRTEIALKRHKLEHDKRHRCEHCGKTYGRKDKLTYHIAATHGTATFLCDQCGSSHRGLRNLQRHVRRCGQFYRCDQCDKKYKKEFQLRIHMLNHKGKVKAFKCDRCDFSFDTKFLLDRHRMGHTGEKPYGCHICSARYVQSYCLRIHLKRQHDITEKVFTCKVCGKSFDKRSVLRQHEETHIEEANGLSTHENDQESKAFEANDNIKCNN